MLNILNCPRCGKVYAKNQRNMCPACIKISDEECERCTKYLRENKTVSIKELSEATKVEINQIGRFIREKRLSIATSPNIHYACETCGGPIRDGNICRACRNRFNSDINKAIQLKQDPKGKESDQNSFFNKNDK
jgi:flagellar operon protein (TIGR03826 family)